jgi:hypothetical protein
MRCAAFCALQPCPFAVPAVGMRFAAASQYFVRCRHAALLSRCSIHAAVRIQHAVPVLPSSVRCASFRALQRRCVSACIAYNLQQPAVSIYFLSHPLGLPLFLQGSIPAVLFCLRASATL